MTDREADRIAREIRTVLPGARPQPTDRPDVGGNVKPGAVPTRDEGRPDTND